MGPPAWRRNAAASRATTSLPAGRPRADDGAHQGELRRFWPDPGGGKAPREPCLLCVAGDAAQLDDRGRAVEGPQASPAPGPPAASSARVRRRARPDRWLAALLVREPRPGMHVDRLYRRRHEPYQARGLRAVGIRRSTICARRRAISSVTAARSPSIRTSTRCSESTIDEAVGGDGMTQFGRALHEFNIDIICANSPQAKGRRRAFIRDVAGSTCEGASACRDFGRGGRQRFPAGRSSRNYNARFGKPPRSDKDVHRPLAHDVAIWRTSSPGRKSARSRTI